MAEMLSPQASVTAQQSQLSGPSILTVNGSRDVISHTQSLKGSRQLSGNRPEDGAPFIKPTHQRFVFTDPVAFRYLEEDPSTTVLQRRQRLEGYELYLVEQWACSRAHPTFVITTYTGDPSHSVVVSVLSVPTNEEAWSQRLRVYFKAVSQFHARRKETPLGVLMVTNLSGFPSALTVIPVPEGDTRKYRDDFIVNVDLKRLGCSGRVGLSLTTPSGATQAKFHQLYKTSERIPIYSAVIEMVKFCQFALVMFGKLGPEYADGLLCDVTERAVNDWWVEMGSEFYNVEPSDGILGPTTVSGLVGMLMGARNRLNAYGAPVAKDCFDVQSLKRGIYYFQKSQKLPKTSRLDRQTLDRLHRVTAKAASGEGWLVPKAVKSTVAELSGKGGEMMMEMVGAREKAGIAEVETLDIDTFLQVIHGERAKWLWYGKPMKSMSSDLAGRTSDQEGMVFLKDEGGGYRWSNKGGDSFDMDSGRRKRDDGLPTRMPSNSQNTLDWGDRDQQLRKNMFKSMTGRMNDARSGLGRIKDAVGRSGLRGHHKHSKEDGRPSEWSDRNHLGDDAEPMGSFYGLRSAPPLSPSEAGDDPFERSFKGAGMVEDSKEPSAETLEVFTPGLPYQVSAGLDLSSQDGIDRVASEGARKDSTASGYLQTREERLMPLSREQSTTGSAYGELGREDPIAQTGLINGGIGVFLRRTQSMTRFQDYRSGSRIDARWPRHLSFSVAEDAILCWKEITFSADGPVTTPDVSQLVSGQSAFTEEAKRMRQVLMELDSQVGAWVEEKLAATESLDVQATGEQENLNSILYQRAEELQSLRNGANDLLSDEKLHLSEKIREVETLSQKLEYELGILHSKVEDVEDGVTDFERAVKELEARAQEFMFEERRKEGWLHWVVRMLFGIGRDPLLAL
ncbi:hypothetical protein L228DRAFT_283257 [Xylona heveae TC161]|uniref:STB6-like N-terminal domain-containing protein n=1 Tax=Xylona heveae (strain CBS 132557 / TC161) TaxID=1328760 RepID=A0A165GDR1_XYLHT|nr:hypothetical protein L228DRAFT_283257 [Xylona heveae TC161]KZF22069.1 hypothetical protein L228DRAFT_283257 [Xylona heveae TC161]